jgi:hypothetical protein
MTLHKQGAEPLGIQDSYKGKELQGKTKLGGLTLDWSTNFLVSPLIVIPPCCFFLFKKSEVEKGSSLRNFTA